MKIRVLYNSKIMLYEKTGIGYYIDNLFEKLSHSEEVTAYPTLNSSSVDKLKHLSGISQFIRKYMGDWLLKITIPAGEFLTSVIEKKGKRDDPDIYHETCYDIIPQGRWKSIANIYDLSFLKYPDYLPDSIVDKCRANIDNILGADRFIVNTHSIKSETAEFFKIHEEKIDVIPLAPSGRYYPVNRDSGEGKEIVNNFTNSDYILFVGTIEPRKNIPILFKAFKIIKEKYDIKLIIAGGKGWYYDEILEIPSKLNISDHVILTGYTDEKSILYLYNYASLVVYPSLYEGFGLPVLEAMSCGVPVIGADIPAIKEVSQGRIPLCSTEDEEELAEMIASVIEDSEYRKELIKNGLEVSNAYNWDLVASRTIDTYKRVLTQ